MREPKVTLLRYTSNPIGTIQAVWDASKTADDLRDIIDQNPCKIEHMRGNKVSFKEASELFKRVIEMEIPVAEFVNFIFVFEDVPIFWREQLVRERVNSYWSQSHRIFDLSKFFDDEMFYVPTSIRANELAEAKLRNAMKFIESTYKDLVALGIPMEDARAVIPSCAIHRISMQINLRHLIGLCKKRNCHILQRSIWAPIIDQIISELVKKVDPIFTLLKTPICFEAGKFNHCAFHHDNERRYDGKDQLPPCCIWMEKQRTDDERELPGLLAGLPDLKAYERAKREMVEYYGDYILE